MTPPRRTTSILSALAALAVLAAAPLAEAANPAGTVTAPVPAGSTSVSSASSAASAPATQTGAEKGQTQHYLGVAVESIPPSISKLLKLKSGQGLLVTKVLENSPADKATLAAGDLLVALDGKPLTNQRQLIEGANRIEKAADGATVSRPVKVAYIREGEYAEVMITPAPRPDQLLVQGNTAGFTPDSTGPRGNRVYATPAGGTVQVGPGYTIDLNAPNAVLSKSIQRVVSEGNTIILTQETDIAGGMRYTISVGQKEYRFSPDSINTLPADLQPLAQQMTGQQRTATRPVNDVPTLEARIKAQEKQIEELNRKMEKLLEKLEEK